MKKTNTVAMLIASVALSAPLFASAQTNDNWRSSDGSVWKNGTNELCWRNANWTPATADPRCDGALKPPAPAPAPKVAPPPAPKAAPAPAPKAAPAPAPAPKPPAKPAAEKVTFAADTFFDFDKSVIKPEGRSKLTTLAQRAKGVNLEVVIAVGHADSTGPDSYNQKLSMRRADAVKKFLVSQGIEANRIYTEGKGEKSPIADNKTREGRAKNRRVEVEVIGTRPTK